MASSISLFFLASLGALAVDLSCASFLQANSNPQVLFFSDSNSVFRKIDNVATGQAPSISPRAVAAASAALLGVPTPPGTNAAVAKEISHLLEPNPFDHASMVVVLAARSVPPLTEDWLRGAASNSLPLRLAQRRELSASEGTPLHSLKRELTIVREADADILRVYPEAEWERTPPTKAQDEEAWDSAVLDGSMLGTKEGYSVSSLVSTFGPKGESFIHDVAQVAKLVEAAGAGSAPGSPALVAASVSLAGLKSESHAGMEQALDAALAVVMDSILKSRKSQDPVALVLVLDTNSPADVHELGLLLPSGVDYGTDGAGRVLTETLDSETETPHEVEVKALYISVWLILLTAISIGMWLMFGINITKDTLLYSGAKID